MWWTFGIPSNYHQRIVVGWNVGLEERARMLVEGRGKAFQVGGRSIGSQGTVMVDSGGA